MKNTGFIRTAAISPNLKVGNVPYNVEEIIKCAREADSLGAGIIIFPELALTSASCGDLFMQELLYRKNIEGLLTVVKESENLSAVIVLGCYARLGNNFYNCAAVIRQGTLIGLVPKIYSDKRWFSDKITNKGDNDFDLVNLGGNDVRFGELLFQDRNEDICFGIVIGNDIKAPLSPVSMLCLKGAHIIININSETATVTQLVDCRSMLKNLSNSNICSIIYASAGVYESTTDGVCSGLCAVSECGKILSEGKRFHMDNNIVYGDIDFEMLRLRRNADILYKKTEILDAMMIADIAPVKLLSVNEKLLRKISCNPFVPEDKKVLDEHCKEIFNIQTVALARRIEHTHAKKITVGISGGLDSTLALLVSVNAMKLLGRPAGDVVAVTMPGFGTSDHTHDNAWIIMETLETDAREIPIGEAVAGHFRDINHDPELHDVTYENAQARERTQILMDLANKEGGFVIGTGDLSELALGWCTYNGDHMSMYSVNADVPKTLVRLVVGWFADNIVSDEYCSDAPQLKKAMYDIMETPISPELLPPDSNGNIAQKTEERVGPYELNEFFIYYMLRYGMRPAKLYQLAISAFDGKFDNTTIKKWLQEFYRRFFAQQFKRNCMPDGPRVGSVSLSPRGAWIMPSDVDVAIWLSEVNEL